MLKVLTIVGNRPQFTKAAVVSRAFATYGPALGVQEILVHTDQHYDPDLSQIFFDELGIPEPRHRLGAGGRGPFAQIGLVMESLDRIIDTERPSAVLVYGDTHSTLAAAIVASHRDIPLAHVEAGERVFRRLRYPEELNRIVTDHAAALCLTATRKAERFLLREGIGPRRIRFVGDPMYDLFVEMRGRLDLLSRVDPADFADTSNGYHLATIHRAENTDDSGRLLDLMRTLDASPCPVLLPLHPRTRKRLEALEYAPRGSLRLLPPLGYADFMKLLVGCRICVTDSGGVSREAFFAGKPCIVPMPNSGWTELVDAGWIVTVGRDDRLLGEMLATLVAPDHAPAGIFGDGTAGRRIVEAVAGLAATPPSDDRFGNADASPTAG